MDWRNNVYLMRSYIGVGPSADFSEFDLVKTSKIHCNARGSNTIVVIQKKGKFSKRVFLSQTRSVACQQLCYSSIIVNT